MAPRGAAAAMMMKTIFGVVSFARDSLGGSTSSTYTPEAVGAAMRVWKMVAKKM